MFGGIGMAVLEMGKGSIAARRGSIWNYVKNNAFVYILMLPALIITFVFAYLPMAGILVAFQDYDIFKGITGSPWAGLKHIIDVVRVPTLLDSVFNTLILSVLTLLFSFPIPILLAVLFNELRLGLFKRTVQTISYLPYFLSWISVIGIAWAFLSQYGTINDLRVLLSGKDTERILFLGKQNLFVPIMITLTLWKEVGWSSIIYLAAISSIDQQLYEAAKIDGASHFHQIRYITFPSILPTIIILLIFNLGGLFNSNFELVYGLQNPFIDFEVISTVVFKRGIEQCDYSMAAAVGFMQGLIAFILVFCANKVSKMVSDIHIW